MKTSTTFVPDSSLFAKLLAEENLIVQIDRTMKTAAFEPSTRRLLLPSYDGFDNDAWLLFLAHEVGHARYTPRDWAKEPCIAPLIQTYGLDKTRFVVNVLEDVRIERLIRQRYQGLAGVFARGYRSLLAKNFFGFPAGQCPWETYEAIDRLNLYAKVGSLLHLTLTEADDIRWYNAAVQAQTFEALAPLAEEILRTLSQQVPPTTPPQSGAQAPSNAASTGMSPQAPQDQPQAPSSLVQSASSAQDQSQGQDRESGQDGQDRSQGDAQDTPAEGASRPSEETEAPSTEAPATSSTMTPRDPFQSKTTEAAEECLRSAAQRGRMLSADHARHVLPRDLSHLHLNDWLLPEILADWTATASDRAALWSIVQRERKQASTVLASMVNTFRMYQSAWQSRREETARTGVLDPTKLSQHKLIEDIFLRRTEVPTAQNHGLVLTMDWSGSMQSSLPTVLTQVLYLIWFAETLRIPVQVFAFSDVAPRSAKLKQAIDGLRQDTSQVEQRLDRMYYFRQHPSLLQFYDSSASATVRREAQSFLLGLIATFSSLGSVYEYRQEPGVLHQAIEGLYFAPKAMKPALKSIVETFDVEDYRRAMGTSFRNLGGTALNHALVSMTDYVRAFREQHRIEQCVSVFLTDGEDTDGLKARPRAQMIPPAGEDEHWFSEQSVSPRYTGEILDTLTGKLVSPTEGAKTDLNQMLQLHRLRTGATLVVLDLSDRPLESYRRVCSQAQMAPFAETLTSGYYARNTLRGKPKVQKQTRRKVVIRTPQGAFGETGLFVLTQPQVESLGCDAMLVSHPAWWIGDDPFTKMAAQKVAKESSHLWDDDDDVKNYAQAVEAHQTTVKLSATLTATTGIVAMRKFADLLVPFIAQGRADAQSL